MIWTSSFLLQFVGLVMATPIFRNKLLAPNDDFDPNRCSLPAEMGIDGTLKMFEDCESLDHYDSLPVPATFYNKIGTNSILCCPPKRAKTAICFETDPWCPNFKKIDYDDYENDVQQEEFGPPDPLERPTLADEVCNNDTTTCVSFTACSRFLDSDENQNELIMIPCGFDDTNSHVKVCCPKDMVDQQPQEVLVKPRFPDRNKAARKCEDKDRKICRKWKKLGGCRKDQPHTLSEINPKAEGSAVSTQDMFDFMILTCQDSCGVCGDRGCVDDHPRCKDWARTGSCFKNPEFMGHTCRESCGSCGFLSPDNTEEQMVGDRSYTDFSGSDFHCGEYKLLCEVNGVSCEEDETTTTTTPRTTTTPTTTSTTTTPTPIDLEVENSLQEFSDDLLFTFANTDPGQLYCGFSIISDRFALEAAHCWNNYQAEGFGDIRFKQLRDDTNETEMITVKKVYRHPLYNPPLLYNDIAVVELSRRVVYDYDVYGDSPSCLDKDLDLPGRNATSVGYGLTEFNTSGDLLAADMKIISNIDCKRFYNENITKNANATKFSKLQLALPYGLDYGLLCTQGFQNDEGVFSGPCKGDSGSPLSTTDDNDRETLVGIVSGGLGCGLGIPPWYTRVSFYYEWVNCIVKSSKTFKGNQKKTEDACRHLAKKAPECDNRDDNLLFDLRSDTC